MAPIKNWIKEWRQKYQLKFKIQKFDVIMSINLKTSHT